MPRIFDNISQQLLTALRATLETASHADFCVGYFNLRGWQALDDLIADWDPGQGQKCRVLIGMQRPPHEEVRELYQVRMDDPEELLDNARVSQLKLRFAQHLREQITFGIPTARDEAGLRQLAKRLRAGQLIVKLFLPYSKADSANIEEINQSIVVVKDHLDLLAKLFHKFDTSPYFTDKPLQQLHCLNMAAEFVQVTDKIEKRFMYLVQRLKAAYDICCGGDAFTQNERDLIHFYTAVRSIVFKLTKGDAPDVAQMNSRVREMIKKALQSDGVEEIFKLGEDGASEIDLFDDDFLKKIEKIKLPHTKIKLLHMLLKKAIEDFKTINKIKGADFSKMLKALVDKYNQRKEQDVLVSSVLNDFTDEIIDLYQALKKEKESFADLGMIWRKRPFTTFSRR